MPVGLIDAARTPWCRRGGALAGMSAADLGAIALRDLLLRAGLRPPAVDTVVVGSSRAANNGVLGRDLALRAEVSAPAFTVSMGDLSGERALTCAVQLLEAREADVVAVVGVDTPSNIVLGLPQPVREAVASSRVAETTADKIRALAGIKAADLRATPQPDTDPIGGQSVLEAAEVLAQRNGIDRRAQDEYAARSHRLAMAAWRAGHTGPRLIATPTPGSIALEVLERDDGPRSDRTVQSLASLPVAARGQPGWGVPPELATVTAGNAAAEADGAAAVLLARTDVCSDRGLGMLARFTAARFAATDPFSAPRQGAIVATRKLCRERTLPPVLEFFEPAAAVALAQIAALEANADSVNAWGGSIRGRARGSRHRAPARDDSSGPHACLGGSHRDDCEQRGHRTRRGNRADATELERC